MQLVKAGLALLIGVASFGIAANSQDSQFMSSREFVDLFSRSQILCYDPDENGNCGWAEFYPQVIGNRLTVLSFASFVDDAETSLPTFGVTVSEADYILNGDRICDPVDNSDNFQAFFYLDPDMRVSNDHRQFYRVNPETERQWRQERRAVDYCFAFSITGRDSANRVVELVQHYFIDNVRQDETDRIVVYQASDHDVRLTPPGQVLIGEPI